MSSTPPSGEPEEERTGAEQGRGEPGRGGEEPIQEQAPWVAPDTAPEQGAAPGPGWQDPPGQTAPGQGWQAPPGWQGAPGWGTPGYQPPSQLPKGGSARSGPLPLHPMTFGDLLDGAFRLLRANLATIVLISAMFFVPLDLFSAFLTRDALGGRGIFDLINDPSLLDQGGTVGFSDPQLVGTGVASLLGLLITPLVGGAITQVVAANYLGEALSVGEAMRATGRRVWALLGASICVHLIELVGTFLCILPGLAAMAFLMCTIPAVVIEGLGPIKGIGRSIALVRPRFWPVLGIAVVSGLLASVLTNVLSWPFVVAGHIIGLHWGFILVAIGSILPALVASPFVSIVATLVYFDGRIRYEGFDLQIIARDLGHGTAPAT